MGGERETQPQVFLNRAGLQLPPLHFVFALACCRQVSLLYLNRPIYLPLCLAQGPTGCWHWSTSTSVLPFAVKPPCCTQTLRCLEELEDVFDMLQCSDHLRTVWTCWVTELQVCFTNVQRTIICFCLMPEKNNVGNVSWLSTCNSLMVMTNGHKRGWEMRGWLKLSCKPLQLASLFSDQKTATKWQDACSLDPSSFRGIVSI